MSTENDYERTEGLHQRDARCLDGRQLRALAKVAEGDERRQQDGQRQGLRHEREPHVPEELRQHLHREPLADEVVDIAPQELHHQHKLADEEGSHKEQPELLGDEYI